MIEEIIKSHVILVNNRQCGIIMGTATEAGTNYVGF